MDVERERSYRAHGIHAALLRLLERCKAEITHLKRSVGEEAWVEAAAAAAAATNLESQIIVHKQIETF